MARHRKRFPIDAGCRLDANELSRCGLFRFEPGERTVVGLRFSNGLELEVTAESYNDDPRLILSHGGVTQFVSVQGVPKPYGGQQWYFLCPVTLKRVSVLWRPYGARKFASRPAYGNAAYTTQFLDPYQRGWRTLRRVAKRLGSTDPNDYNLPDKPPLMRWTTYEALADRYEAASDKMDRLAVVAIGRAAGLFD